MNKAIILIGLIVLVGCNLDTVEPHESSFEKGLNTTNTSFMIWSNASMPSISFSESQIIMNDMDCYPVSCPSNLCLECKIDNETVNFTRWFR